MSESSIAQPETSVAELCALLLDREKQDGRFTMEMDDVRRVMKLTAGELARLVMQAVELDWVRLSSGRIELKATGIHMAKKLLGLQR